MIKKARASDLKSVSGHRNFYRSEKSGIIYFKDAVTPKFSTGEITIGRAKKEVERRKLELAGKSKEDARDISLGITNPLIIRSWYALMKVKKTENSASTMLKYWVNWNHGIKNFWGTKRVLDISDANVEAYKRWYLEAHPTRYALKTVVHLGMLFRTMHKKKVLAVMPDLTPLENLDAIISKNTKRLKVGRPYDEETEVQPMLKAAKTVSKEEYLCARTFLGVLLGVRCGMRKESEILKLPWDKVDFKNRVINVWSMKNHKWREVPMTDDVILAFKWQQRFTGNTPWVFAGFEKASTHISSQVFDHYWYRVQDMANIKDRHIKNAARFHDLRGTFASRTANDGWPVKVACDVLDMSIKEYERTYAKSSGLKRNEWMEKTFGTSKNKEKNV